MPGEPAWRVPRNQPFDADMPEQSPAVAVGSALDGRAARLCREPDVLRGRRLKEGPRQRVGKSGG